MTPALGKRKRVTREELHQPSRSPSPSPSDVEESDNEDLQAIFRRAFEAKFKPIDIEPVHKKPKEVGVEDVELEEESDWSGISSEDEDQVEVVEYTGSHQEDDKASKAELRAFMSAKPPSSSTSTVAKGAIKPDKTPDDPLEASHLKNDLELQSLLRESTLLSSHNPTYSTRTPTARSTANARHKLTDLHIQTLGAKSSIFTQKSMPMSHRKGIAAKQKFRDEKRRSEAKENGVILEKEKKAKKVVGRRERGVGAPSVGRFKGGTLTLSRKDVASITGGGGRGGGKGKKGRR